MILYPAIDLKGGQCVRLRQGDMGQATVFHDDPAEQARAFERQGFSWLHLVDLEGAISGAPVNSAAVKAILGAITAPVQLGGGIRTRAMVEFWLEAGVARVILGTLAVRDPTLTMEILKAYPGRIALGLDARDGRIAVDGWTKSGDIAALELGARFANAGACALIYTDISRDGLLAGINIEATLALANALPIPVIASGGLAGLADIARLLQPDCAKIAGVIAGRALYDGRLDARAALALIQAHKDGTPHDTRKTDHA